MNTKAYLLIAGFLLLLLCPVNTSAQIVTYQTLYEEVPGIGLSGSGFHQGPSVAIYPDAAASYVQDMIGGDTYGHIIYRNSPTTAYKIDLPVNLVIEDMEAYPFSSTVVFGGHIIDSLNSTRGIIGYLTFNASDASFCYSPIKSNNIDPVTRVKKVTVFTGVDPNLNGVAAICTYNDHSSGFNQATDYVYRGPVFIGNIPNLGYDMYTLPDNLSAHDIVATDDYVCVVSNDLNNSNIALRRALISNTSITFDPYIYEFSTQGYDAGTIMIATPLNYQKNTTHHENDIAICYSCASLGYNELMYVFDINTMTELNVQLVTMYSKVMALGLKYMADCSTLVMLNGEDPFGGLNAKTILYLNPYVTTSYSTHYIAIEPGGYCFIDRLAATPTSLHHFLVGWAANTAHWFFKDACVAPQSDCNYTYGIDIQILKTTEPIKNSPPLIINSYQFNKDNCTLMPTQLKKNTICTQQ